VKPKIKIRFAKERRKNYFLKSQHKKGAIGWRMAKDESETKKKLLKQKKGSP